MNAGEFVRKWAASAGRERAHSQEHFLDICRLLGERTPAEADPSGTIYTFEKGALTPDGDGFADVWLKDHFAWEYKGKHKDLGAAYKQVNAYREALGNSPLLVVSDMDRFEIHTNWTNTEKWIYRFGNIDLLSDKPVEISTVSAPAKDGPRITALQVLKALFEDTERLKPQRTTEQITQEAARLFGKISEELYKWKVDDMRIARFVTRVLFCMFATDVGLLRPETFSDIVKHHAQTGDDKGFRRYLAELFSAMNTGGYFSMRRVPHFDGRLFEDDDVPKEVTTQEVRILAQLDALNWAEVEPSIFGALFERVLDPKMRKKLGAHYTSRADIELVVEPVLMEPLRREWEDVKGKVEEYLYSAGIRGSAEGPQLAHVRSLLAAFRDRLAAVRVLDPACGSGNFLYVSLALLKGLEKEVIAFAAIHGVTDVQPRVHPRQLFGLEISPYAVELASIVIWIGYLQWKHRNAMPLDDEEPILQPLDQIKLQDAIVMAQDDKPREPDWPAVDVIVGNPPFLGGKMLRRSLGDEEVDAIFVVWEKRVARESDLCCYWFEKARAAIEVGRAKRVGLLATQAIRGGANRRVLERIKQTGDIFYAQADRKWIQDGVAVRVSMVGFDDGSETRRRLNQSPDDNPEGALDRALPVEGINANLTSTTDLTKARRLKENIGISFMGDTKVGPFEISEAVAKRLLPLPNPHGRPNSDVIRPWVNGLDITRRRRNMWIIDFPPGTTEEQAALYETPFKYVNTVVRPMRAKAKSGDATGVPWWIHQRPRPDMRRALRPLSRYLGTPRLTKYRFFVWLRSEVLSDAQLIVFARDDDYFFGILHSRPHEVWALRMGTQLEDRPRYTPTTTFETFPLPHASDEQRESTAEAARELNSLREAWLNPEPVDGLPLPEKQLKARTLTNLYNERPTWLANAHAKLDEAVFAAYGWSGRPDELTDAEILARLLELNLEREPG
jgi:type II restriction/modification system DNA methylase subunit YeeA